MTIPKSTLPLLSIILPVYNAEQFILECLDSILKQTLSDFELLIIDDGSSDSSLLLMKSISDHRITIKSRENKGLGKSLNELIEMANTNLIVRMDADDVMLPNRLQIQYDFMIKNPQCSLSGVQIKYYNGQAVLSRTPFPLDDTTIKKDLNNIIFSVCHPALIFRKDVSEKVENYKIDGVGEDLDFILRMGDHGEILNSNEVGLLYRYSSNSITSKRKRELNKMYAFTIEKRKNSNLTLIEFERFWENRSLKNRVLEMFSDQGNKYYENYIKTKSINNIQSSIFLLLSVILKPAAVQRHVIRRIKHRLNL